MHPIPEKYLDKVYNEDILRLCGLPLLGVKMKILASHNVIQVLYLCVLYQFMNSYVFSLSGA